MNAPGRIVALDVGTKRIGVAACDPTRTVVRSVSMVGAQPPERAVRDIVAVLQDEEAVALVIGMPWTLAGEIGPQALRVMQFVEILRPHVSIPIHFYDERLTSAEAERLLKEYGGGFTKAERRQGRVDKLAALLILEDYLQEERLRNRPPYDPDDDDWERGDGERR